MAAFYGCQTPTVATGPEGTTLDADDAIELSSAYGLTPDEWQENVLRTWMVRRPNGKWAAGRWGLAVPRQNGKNGVLEIVELYFMVGLGLKILHTAHEVKTARKAFVRIVSFFENERKYPELAALVKEIRRTNGQEAILLHTSECPGGDHCDCKGGGSVEFIARSKNSGRGFTVDVLVCDESQEYDEDSQAALLPTISSGPSGDPLQILLGTPPAENMKGDVFTRMRDAGVRGDDARLAWCEWSISGDVDVSDKTLWALVNPSLGIRLNLTTIEDEFAAMGAAENPDMFARERLGMWATADQLAVIPGTVWAARAVDGAPEGFEISALGLDMNPERTVVNVAVAVRTDDGKTHVELASLGIDEVAKTEALVAWIQKRARRRIPVVMDAFSPARALEPMLKEKKVKVYAMSGGELMQACGGFYDAVVKDRSLTHFDQLPLNTSLLGAKKKTIGDAGGWKWSRKDFEDDLTPLMAATCAHFGAVKFGKVRPTTPTNDTSREAVIL
jgi:hypothetical protein